MKSHALQKNLAEVWEAGAITPIFLDLKDALVMQKVGALKDRHWAISNGSYPTAGSLIYSKFEWSNDSNWKYLSSNHHLTEQLKDVSIRLSRGLQAKHEPKRLACLKRCTQVILKAEGAATYAPTGWKTTNVY